MSAVVVLLTTLPPELAPTVVETLVREGVIACGNIVPAVQSIYVWQGELCRDTEALVICETAAASRDAALARLRALHPYECPKLIAIDPAAVGDDYLRWAVAATTRGAQPDGSDVPR